MKFYWERWDYETEFSTELQVIDSGIVEADEDRTAKTKISKASGIKGWAKWDVLDKYKTITNPDDPIWIRRKEARGKSAFRNDRSFPHIIVYRMWRNPNQGSGNTQ